MSSVDVLRNQDPEAYIAHFESREERYETPCGDGTMVWRSWGDGEPLVLAHGAQGCWQHWIRNIDALSAARRIVVPDLPGHGDSASPAAGDHAGVAEPLAVGLREIFGDGLPVDMCGFSFGGVALTYTAALHPDVARRVVLVGCGGLDTPLGDVRIGRVGGLEGEARSAAIKANLLGLMLHHPDSADQFAISRHVPNARKSRLDVPPMVLPDRLNRIFPQVTAPVDAIWGEFDRPHPAPDVQEEALRRFYPDADFRVVEDAGHWAMYERPEAFDAALLGILANPPRSAP
ncbi:MAG: alpha/beta hydrolase [Novosphingobium sp.]|nr:alpha/beta hydrolase [Novosphingobium sp.]